MCAVGLGKAKRGMHIPLRALRDRGRRALGGSV